MEEQRDELCQREYKERLRERNGCVNEERVFMQRDGERTGAPLIFHSTVLYPLSCSLEMPFSLPSISNESFWILDPDSHPEVFLQSPSLPNHPFVPR